MERQERGRITLRVLRDGERRDDGWAAVPVEERLAAVWRLTLACLAWNREEGDEPRLQRTAVRVLRRRR